jgi:predicted ATPase/DNA-binding winged helix-turn-helix (wHTH) protein
VRNAISAKTLVEGYISSLHLLELTPGRRKLRQLVYEARGLEVDLAKRELRIDGKLVPIGGRAFEIIEVLAVAKGELVSKQNLMNAVWPGAIVEEHTLQVHISSVRKALGANRDMLKTASGKGYRLVADWTMRKDSQTATSPTDSSATTFSPPPFTTNIALAGIELVGRSAAVQTLRDLLSASRVVTLNGPGGIGKTALALETARSLSPYIQGDIRLVELSSLSDGAQVPAAVAATLDLNLGKALTPESIARAIGSKAMMLLLDTCEHVVDGVAAVVEAILDICPRATVLATSREILRVQGEQTFRVLPLDLPEEIREDGGDILGHSAIQLFINRTTALNADFAPTRRVLPSIATICRRLDGIPLAIELAAARAATLGVNEVASLLDDRFALLTTGRRKALPRHRTLRATLDWSYDLLSDQERTILQRLAIFAGSFTLQAARQIAADRPNEYVQVIEAIGGLVDKSLLNHEIVEGLDFYRLLDTTRDYARSELLKSGERRNMDARLAANCVTTMDLAEADWGGGVDSRWRSVYCRRIDDIRNALDWAFSNEGDAAVGVLLAAKSDILWITLGLTHEYGVRAQGALEISRAAKDPDYAIQMRLLSALGAIHFHSKGPCVDDDALQAFSESYACALKAGDAAFQMRTLSASSSVMFVRGNYPAAADLAKRIAAIPSADSHVADRTLGYALHALGEISAATHHLDSALGGATRSNAIRFSGAQFDQNNVTLRSICARNLWLIGRLDQALDLARECVSEALAANHAISLCLSLIVSACPIAFACGGRAAAEHFVDLLNRTSTRHSLSFYREWPHR